jgi:hypothetical protein
MNSPSVFETILLICSEISSRIKLKLKGFGGFIWFFQAPILLAQTLLARSLSLSQQTA